VKITVRLYLIMTDLVLSSFVNEGITLYMKLLIVRGLWNCLGFAPHFCSHKNIFDIVH
jgi:hypothetical protein